MQHVGFMMGSTLAAPASSVAAAMMRSFRHWAENDTKYRRTFRKITPDAIEIVDAALSEMYEYKPFVWNHWWATEHMRFRRVKGEQTRLVYEIMYEFLGRYCTGKLNDDEPHEQQPARKKRGRPATVESQ